MTLVRDGAEPVRKRLDQVAAMARRPLHDAVACQAVARDNHQLCAWLDDDDERDCRRAVQYYRWARNPSSDLSWQCDDEGRRKAQKDKLSAAGFEALCAALRTRDPAKCPPAHTDVGDGCRAEVTLDATYCRGRQHCIEAVARTKEISTRGLKERIAAATGLDRALAEAALTGPSVCAPLVDALRSACLAFEGNRDGGTPSAVRRAAPGKSR